MDGHDEIEDLLTVWQREWIARLKPQVLTLHHRKQVHDEFQNLIAAAPRDGGGVFWNAFHDMYIESQVLAVRRLVDGGGQTISLRRLIGQLDQHRSSFVRGWYVERWLVGVDDEHKVRRLREDAERFFSEFTDDGDPDRLGGATLARHRDELAAATDRVRVFANENVAHLQRAPGPAATYGDFEAAVAHVGDLFTRYHDLLTFSSLVTVTPTIQANWTAPFEQPLVQRSYRAE